MPRFAVITTSYPAYEGDPSGHFVQAEVNELERSGMRPQVLVIRPEPGGAFGWPGAPTRIRERPSRLFEAGVWAARSIRRVVQYQPDRVIAHWALPSVFPIALRALAKLPACELEVVSHGGDVRLLCRMPERARRHVMKKILARTTRWRFVSEELCASLEKVLDPEHAHALRAVATIVPSAIEVPDVHDDSRSKRSTVAGRRLYVCAGRLVASKRVDKVIDYVATSANHGTKRHERVLVILGDGPERDYLERVAREWQLDVRFLGVTNRREALGWIGAADELVHASRVEGLSTVVREAEELGVPVTLL